MRRSSAILVAFLLLSQILFVQPFHHQRPKKLKETYVGSSSISPGLKEDLKKNGLAADQIGVVAPPTEECGVIHFDYSPYEDGSLFKKTAQPYVEKLKSFAGEERFLQQLVEDEFVFFIEQHKKDMKEVFDDLRSRVPTSNVLQSTRNLGFFLELFGGIAIVEFAVGFLWEAGTSIYDKLFADQGDRLDDLYKAWNFSKNTIAVALNSTRDLMLKEIYSNRVSGVLNYIRQEYVETLKDGLEELLEENRFHPAFTGCELNKKKTAANSTVWVAISHLFGERFVSSVLARKGCDSMAVIKASVSEMTRKYMRVNICYPIASESDVNPLIKAEALGSFVQREDGKQVFRYPHVHPLYAVPANCDAVNCLVKIAEETCVSFSELYLCSRSSAIDKCPLEHGKRTQCSVTDIVVEDERKFVFTRSILETTIVATKAPSGVGYYNNGQRERFVFTTPVSAVVLPPDSRLEVLETIITSRIWTAEGRISFMSMPTVPVLAEESWIWSALSFLQGKENVSLHLTAVTGLFLLIGLALILTKILF